MNLPAELALHQYLEDAVTGKSSMSQDTIKQIGDDVMAAAQRQFGGGNKRDKFGLRMSNVGRPTCQLWYGPSLCPSGDISVRLRVYGTTLAVCARPVRLLLSHTAWISLFCGTSSRERAGKDSNADPK